LSNVGQAGVLFFSNSLCQNYYLAHKIEAGDSRHWKELVGYLKKMVGISTSWEKIMLADTTFRELIHFSSGKRCMILKLHQKVDTLAKLFVLITRTFSDDEGCRSTDAPGRQVGRFASGG
jgi:hypothetical protein